MKLHPVLKLAPILFTLYFALVWLKVLPHPAWLPAEVEPLTIIAGLVLTGFAWWEDIVEKIRAQLPRQEPKYLSRPPAQLSGKAVGRVGDLKKLRKELHFARRPVVVCAIGGLGKTTLAQMFWQQQKTRYDHVAWLSAVAVFSAEEERQAENADYFLRAFTDNVELKTALPVLFDPQERPVEHFRRVLTALAGVPGRNLLVVDNVPGAAAQYAEELSKLSENWKILLTSREAIPNMERFELDALPPEEAARVFWNIYADSGGTTRSRVPDLDTLLRAIGYHTLTIELLAAYAREKKLDIPDLRRELEARGLAQLDGYNLTVPKSGKNQPLHAHLRETFLLDLGEREKELMRFFCILPPAGAAIDSELMREDFLCDLLGKTDDKIAFHNLLHELVRLHWLVEDDGTYACHPVIADTAKVQLLPDAENCSMLINNVTNLLIPDEKINEPVIARASIAPLGEAVFKGVWKEDGNFVETDDATARLALRLGWLFDDLGEFYKALEFKLKMVAIRGKVLSAEHPDLAISYNNLAETYGAMGDHQKSLEFHQKARAIWEKVLPSEHPDLASSYNNLGVTYGALGDHQKSLEFHQKALTIWEKVLPSEHPHLASSYNNLAETYGSLGEHQKSLEFHQKALAIREKVLPSEHPDLAGSYNNLAATYGDLGEHQKSLEFHQKALAIREKVLPSEHPDLARSYNNLAATYGSLGEHQKSLEFHQKARAIWEKVLPSEHPDLARSYNNLAVTYWSLGEHQKSLDYNQKALGIREKVLPSEHPDLAISYNNLGWNYHDLGDLNKACDYMRRALAILEKSLPPEHPYVLGSRESLKKFEAKRQEQGKS
jgi:tetratricopeptide (TPR) repeat protein